MTDQAPDKAGPDLPAERDDETREDEVQPLSEPLQVLKTLRHIIDLEEKDVSGYRKTGTGSRCVHWRPATARISASITTTDVRMTSSVEEE